MNLPGTKTSSFISRNRSIVEDNVRQQFGSHGDHTVVFDQAQSPEFVHEVSDPRPRSAHHFGESLVTHVWHLGLGHGLALTETSQLQQNAGEPLLAMVEELIAEVLFQIDVPGQQ